MDIRDTDMDKRAGFHGPHGSNCSYVQVATTHFFFFFFFRR